jgi:hypothetical protein
MLLSALLHYVHVSTFIISILLAIINSCAILILSIFCKQQNNNQNVAIQVPLVPILPVMSIVFNIFFLMISDLRDWGIFFVIILAGKYFV